ncbi:hypothetical protein RXR99_29770, partial [Pseudomonas aeruginosa]|nr:hypothetical protein [Pseudomonas aeruginosa]
MNQNGTTVTSTLCAVRSFVTNDLDYAPNYPRSIAVNGTEVFESSDNRVSTPFLLALSDMVDSRPSYADANYTIYASEVDDCWYFESVPYPEYLQYKTADGTYSAKSPDLAGSWTPLFGYFSTFTTKSADIVTEDS